MSKCDLNPEFNVTTRTLGASNFKKLPVRMGVEWTCRCGKIVGWAKLFESEGAADSVDLDSVLQKAIPQVCKGVKE